MHLFCHVSYLMSQVIIWGPYQQWTILLVIPHRWNSTPHSPSPAPRSSVLPGPLASCRVWLTGDPSQRWEGGRTARCCFPHCLPVSLQLCPLTALASVTWPFLHDYNSHWAPPFARMAMASLCCLSWMLDHPRLFLWPCPQARQWSSH